MFNLLLCLLYVCFGDQKKTSAPTMLKGIQDPSLQVNSAQLAVVFLLPGDGETVLSGQNKI